MRDLAGIEANLVKAMQDGTVPEACALDTALERQRAWVSDMWNRPCTPTAYAGLADIYESHPDVTQRYETLGKGFSRWLPAAMRAGVRRMPEAWGNHRKSGNAPNAGPIPCLPPSIAAPARRGLPDRPGSSARMSPARGSRRRCIR